MPDPIIDLFEDEGDQAEVPRAGYAPHPPYPQAVANPQVPYPQAPYPPGMYPQGMYPQGASYPGGAAQPQGADYPVSKYLRPMEDYPAEYPSEYPPEVPRPPMAGRHGRADRVQMKPGHADEQHRSQVKYFGTLMERLKYRVTIGTQMMRRFAIFDTKEIKKHFSSKDRGADTGRAGLGMNNLGDRELMKEWYTRGLIWVCADGANGPDFYSHVGKMNRFHHSSFFSGGELIGAGEWIVEGGKLKKISANSGHYQPSITFLHQSVQHLAGALHDDTVVLLWEVAGGKWIEVPAREFVNNAGGGRWKSHPNA